MCAHDTVSDVGKGTTALGRRASLPGEVPLYCLNLWIATDPRVSLLINVTPHEELHLGDLNWKFFQVRYPVRTPTNVQIMVGDLGRGNVHIQVLLSCSVRSQVRGKDSISCPAVSSACSCLDSRVSTFHVNPYALCFVR